MHYAFILVVDFNIFNTKSTPTKLTAVYTTLQQKVRLALIWLVGLKREKIRTVCLCVCVCVLFLYFL